MKPRGFDFTVECLSLTRHVSDDPTRPSGWLIEAFIGSSTSVRLFIPDDFLVGSRCIGATETHEPIYEKFFIQPDVRPGELLSMSLTFPVREVST